MVLITNILATQRPQAHTSDTSKGLYHHRVATSSLDPDWKHCFLGLHSSPTSGMLWVGEAMSLQHRKTLCTQRTSWYHKEDLSVIPQRTSYLLHAVGTEVRDQTCHNAKLSLKSLLFPQTSVAEAGSYTANTEKREIYELGSRRHGTVLCASSLLPGRQSPMSAPAGAETASHT